MEKVIAEGWVDLKKVEQEVDEEAQAKVDLCCCPLLHLRCQKSTIFAPADGSRFLLWNAICTISIQSH